MNLPPIPELSRLHLNATRTVLEGLNTKVGITPEIMHNVTAILQMHLLAMIEGAMTTELTSSRTLDTLFGAPPEPPKDNAQ